MALNDILTVCKLKAYDSLLNPSEESVWRALTRSYAEKWNVPLPEVRRMVPEEVILDVLEDRLENMDVFEEIETILEDIYKIEDPNYEKEQQAEMEGFIKNIEKKEKERLKKDKDKEDKQKTALRAQRQVSGFVDFSKLKEDK